LNLRRALRSGLFGPFNPFNPSGYYMYHLL
jgi:hypothetical protein